MKYLFAIFWVLTFIYAGFAFAQPQQCAPHSVVKKLLKDTAGEDLIWHGLDSRGLTVRIYLNHDTGGWSLTVQGRGPECMSVIGQAGTKLPYIKPAPGDAI
tara:strand:+ start:3698 stop:4000 length:303 start_codon:yes stop_codon:yes gene_type:complete